MPDYLLEIRSDEIPVRLLQGAVKQLGVRLFEDLVGRGLAPSEMVSGVTPRRLAFLAYGIPEVEPDREQRELGPPVQEAHDEEGEPTEALLGFAVRVGVEVEDLETIKTEKGEYIGHVRKVEGRPVAEVLAERVPAILRDLRWRVPKLRLTSEEPFWIRPVRGIVSLLDGEVIPVELDGQEAGNETSGHPILSPEPFEVEGPADYLEKLGELGVEVRFEVRRRRLGEALAERAEELGGQLHDAPELIRQLALRTEIPGVVDGAFDASYLSLPREILLAALEERQSAFAVLSGEDVLPCFITVMDRPDDPEGLVRRGQEFAAAGRLADARFHYETDRRSALAERARRLDQLPFRKGLGHYAAKTARLQALVELIAAEAGWDEEAAAAQEAAALLKADLTTAMVRDFPALKGVLGGIYARQEGYVESVWQAIYDQYFPLNLYDDIPRERAGVLVAVADRLDTLVGFFGIGEAPTGSRDPQGLRRLAAGLLRLLIEAEMALDLDLVAARAVFLYNEDDRVLERGAEDIVTRLQTFLADRLRYVLGQRDFEVDEIEAAMAVGSTNLPELSERLKALKTVRGEESFHSLVQAAKRIFNIVQGAPEHELKPELLEEEAEKDLYADLVEVRRNVDEAVERRDYAESLRAMTTLVPHLDRFMAEVLVMAEDEDVRANRMALLQSVRRVFWRTARLKEMRSAAAETSGT